MGRGRGETDDQLLDQGIQRFALDDLIDLAPKPQAARGASPLAGTLRKVARMLESTRNGAATHDVEVGHLAGILWGARKELLAERRRPEIQEAVSDIAAVLTRSLIVTAGPTPNDLSAASLDAALKQLSHNFEVGSASVKTTTPLIVRYPTVLGEMHVHLRVSELADRTLCGEQVRGRLGTKAGWQLESARGFYSAIQNGKTRNYIPCQKCLDQATQGLAGTWEASMAAQEDESYADLGYQGFDQFAAPVFEKRIWAIDSITRNQHAYARLFGSAARQEMAGRMSDFRALLRGYTPSVEQVVERLIEEPQRYGIYPSAAILLRKLAKSIRKAGYKQGELDPAATDAWLAAVAEVSLNPDISCRPDTWALLACKHLFPKALDRNLLAELRREDGFLLKQLGI